jgi:hypothetical protein
MSRVNVRMVPMVRTCFWATGTDALLYIDGFGGGDFAFQIALRISVVENI